MSGNKSWTNECFVPYKKEKMGDEKAKLDKYPCPENVKGLRTPKVNPSIWSQLSTSMKT